MNEKLCKRLRASARMQTVGAPARGLTFVRKVIRKSKESFEAFIARNAQGTTRWVYRKLKQWAREQQRKGRHV